MIGAGLKALERNKDGAGANELFHMFAVTQEDFVHPIAVIELLWRACCASEAEQQESSLTTRLKVRQWTQMLVDHSLLLGSSSEGVHLHDIVLQYLRKRLTAEEMRTEQTKVVEGMIAASRARIAATGRGLQDTGTTVKAHAGEEVDWYCCNVGPYHLNRAIDPSVGIAEDQMVLRLVVDEDKVLVRAVATAVGTEDLAKLVAHFMQREMPLHAVKVEWEGAKMAGINADLFAGKVKAVIGLIEEHNLSTDEAQQLELEVRAYASGYGVPGHERKAHLVRMKALMAGNDALRLNPITMAWSMVYEPNNHLIGISLSKWEAGLTTVTEATMYEWHTLYFQRFIPLYVQAENESVGARREALRTTKQAVVGWFMPIAGSARAAALMHQFLQQEECWGRGPLRTGLMDECATHAYGRHAEILQQSAAGQDFFSSLPCAAQVLEHGGNPHQASVIFMHQVETAHDILKEDVVRAEGMCFFRDTLPAFAHCDFHGLRGGLHRLRPAIARLLHEQGFIDTTEAQKWFEESALWAYCRQRINDKNFKTTSSNGKIHFIKPIMAVSMSCAVLSWAAGSGAMDVGWLDVLPLEDDRRLTCLFNAATAFVSCRALVAERLEEAGRTKAAIRFASAECADPLVHNGPSRARAGRLIGRCHAKLGQHQLSCSALDAALQLAEEGQFLAQAVLTVRARAVAGRAAGGINGHWSELTGRQRLTEAVGEMQLPGGGEERAALVAALLPPAKQ